MAYCCGMGPVIRWAAVGALVLAAGLAACRVPEVGGGASVQFSDYPDVPVPAGMVLDGGHSLRLETPAVGSVVNVYRGGMLTPSALADHFLKQMPDLGWHLLSRFQNESTILVFKKEGRLCLVGIGIDRGSPTLSVIVGGLGDPEAQAPTRRN